MSLRRTDAVLRDGEAEALSNSSPAAQNAELGHRLQELQDSSPYVQKVAVAADATGGQAVQAEVSGEVIDVWAVCTVANASGTLTLRRSTDAISSAITCAVQDVLSRSTSLVQGQKAVTRGEALNVKANGAADRGILYFAIRRA
jgi:hypothetical protein